MATPHAAKALSYLHAARRALAALAMLAVATPAPASVKPCRDAAGRVIECAKVRKPVKRCKDAAGKFVRCESPAEAKPAPR